MMRQPSLTLMVYEAYSLQYDPDSLLAVMVTDPSRPVKVTAPVVALTVATAVLEEE